MATFSIKIICILAKIVFFFVMGGMVGESYDIGSIVEKGKISCQQMFLLL